jgi:hypothetical protein
MKILRDYQENAALEIAGRSGSTLVCLPTGSGKTVIAAAVIELLKETVVFVVPRIELIRQAREAARTAAAAEKKAAELEKKIRDGKIPAARYVDSDRTFEFCKKNYCLYRRSIAAGCLSDIQALPPEERGAEIHRRTVAELRKALENYDFLPDEMTFSHSMNYWFNNYRDVYQGRRSNT